MNVHGATLSRTYSYFHFFKNRISGKYTGRKDGLLIRMLFNEKVATQLAKQENLTETDISFLRQNSQSPSTYGEIFECGELFEKYRLYKTSDVFYRRCVNLDSKNLEALESHERLFPFTRQIDQHNLKLIDSKKVHMHLKLNAYELQEMREIRLPNIYRSQEFITDVDTRVDYLKKIVMEANEITGILDALPYINTELIFKTCMDLNVLLKMNEKLMKLVNPQTAGILRIIEIGVDEYEAPAASQVPGLMKEFSNFLQSADFNNLHPVHAAALAHYYLVYIHPFQDGNGRTARLLMNYYLVKNGYPPIVIGESQRDLYFDLIQVAHEGDIRPFYRFVYSLVEDALDAVLQSIN